ALRSNRSRIGAWLPSFRSTQLADRHFAYRSDQSLAAPNKTSFARQRDRVQGRPVKMAIVALVLVAGCASNTGVTSASSGQPADGGVIADAGTPDAGTLDTCPLSPHWVRDWALPVGSDATLLFHSPQPSDLWLESFDDVNNYAQLYHRAAG